mgnify:CR=1 FL=1|jgi:hypothetical protein
MIMMSQRNKLLSSAGPAEKPSTGRLLSSASVEQARQSV